MKIQFWIGLFLGVTVVILFSNIKNSKNLLKKKKESQKSMLDIAKEEAVNEIQQSKIELLSKLGLSNLVYNTFMQRLANIFRVVEIIVVIILFLLFVVIEAMV